MPADGAHHTACWCAPKLYRQARVIPHCRHAARWMAQDAQKLALAPANYAMHYAIVLQKDAEACTPQSVNLNVVGLTAWHCRHCSVCLTFASQGAFNNKAQATRQATLICLRAYLTRAPLPSFDQEMVLSLSRAASVVGCAAVSRQGALQSCKWYHPMTVPLSLQLVPPMQQTLPQEAAVLCCCPKLCSAPSNPHSSHPQLHTPAPHSCHHPVNIHALLIGVQPPTVP
jgi:hypothetical protein